jgi:hypothetical protein
MAVRQGEFMAKRGVEFGPAWREILLRSMQYVFYVLLLAVIIPYGSVDPEPLHVFSTGFFALAMVAVLIGRPTQDLKLVIGLAIVIILVVGAWTWVQTVDIGDLGLANPIWLQASDFVGELPGSISLAPADTLQALIPTLLPFAIFITAVFLFSTDDAAYRLFRFVAISGMAVAAFGLVEFVFFPGQMLFNPKDAYYDSLTAVFVYRNATATYLGIVLVFSYGLAFQHIQNAGFSDFLRRFLGERGKTRTSDFYWACFYIAGAAVVFIALMLTKSRAGIFVAFLGLLLLAGVLAFKGGYRRTSRHKTGFSERKTKPLERFARVAGALALIVAAGALFAGRALLRAEAQGLDDARFCMLPSIGRLLGDNWLTGTGLGTFATAFQPYRDPTCGGLKVAWDRAHNVYLEGWISMCVLFPILAVLVIFALSLVLVRGVRDRKLYRWAPAAGLAVLVLVVVHSAIDFSIQIPGVAAAFATALASAVVIAAKNPRTKSTGAGSGA